MSMEKSGSPSSWLGCTDGIAAQWQDFLLLARPRAAGLDFHFQRLAQADGHSGLRQNDAAPRPAGFSRLHRAASGIHRRALPAAGTGHPLRVAGHAVFLIIASFSSHRFWAVEQAQVGNQSSHFWKNVSMMGGTVLLFITGAGRYAIDAFLQPPRRSSPTRDGGQRTSHQHCILGTTVGPLGRISCTSRALHWRTPFGPGYSYSYGTG